MKKAQIMDKHPLQTSISMKKAQIMDKHSIRTSTSMRKAQIMDKHPIRTSVSMKKAQIMDKHPIRTSKSKPQFDDFYYISENRAFRRECHIRCTESSTRRHTSGDCCKMHRTSGRGGESLARESLKTICPVEEVKAWQEKI